MNIKEYQQSKISFLNKVFDATESCLSEHNFVKNLQCPELVKMVVIKMGLDFDQVKEVDAHVRMYLRDHPSYVSSRGRNGGIMQKDKRDLKSAAKSARAEAKQKAKEIVETRLLDSSSTTSSQKMIHQLDEVSQDDDDIDFPVED